MKIDPKVVQAENQEPVATEIIAQSIKKVSDGIKAMDRSGLSEKAIILLLRDASGCGKREVENILWALRNLEKLYLKVKP